MAVDCALPLDCSDTYGALTIDGWSLHTGAWCAFDLSTLYESAEHRGSNVLVESLPGRVARPLLADETEISLPMLFSGAVNRLGAAHADSVAGLFTNRAAFTARLIAPIRAGVASLPASLAVPGGPALTGGVQPLRLGWNLLPNGYARATLTLRIPGGSLN